MTTSAADVRPVASCTSLPAPGLKSTPTATGCSRRLRDRVAAASFSMIRFPSRIFLASAALLVGLVGETLAQERFQTGPVAWTPVITLRDAGVDTNMFDEPS